jgi:hypothetical protein
LNFKLYIKYVIFNKNYFISFNGDWGLGIGDWGLGIGDWAQSPIPNPQSPIPIERYFKLI